MPLTVKIPPLESIAHITILNKVCLNEFNPFVSTISHSLGYDLDRIAEILNISYPNLSFTIGFEEFEFNGIDSRDNIDHVILHNISERIKMIFYGIQEYSLHNYPTIISGGFLSDMIWRFFIGSPDKSHNTDIDFFIYGDKLNMKSLKQHPDYYLSSKDYGQIIDFASYYHNEKFSPETQWGELNVIVTEKKDPFEIVSKFDFEHCKPFWSNQDNKLYISPEQLDLIKNKRLYWSDIEPSEERMQKYIARGWTPCRH
jgi:hypothetical protein